MNSVPIHTQFRAPVILRRSVLLATVAVSLTILLVGCSLPALQPEQAPSPLDANSAAESPLVETPSAPANTSPQGEQGPAAELEPEQRVGMYDGPPEMSIDTDAYYYATLRTEKGDIKVQLFADRAPMTVNNFVFLAQQGFYDNTTFHRVIDGFMAQAGDPAGTGAGGPGYQFEDEFFPGLEFDQAGLLAMANRGPGTNGSQFFITYGPTEWLNGGHTIFGKVIEGEDVLAELTRVDPQVDADLTGDILYGVDIEQSDVSILPTPTPSPPTPTPTPTPTPFAPTDLDAGDRPLAEVPPADRVDYFNTAPESVLETGKQYEAVISTSKGEFTVQLYADQAPVAVNNFVVLANLGYYDNTPISLVRPDDSIIFGLPDGNPQSDAGYSIDAELNPDIELKLGVLTNIPIDNGTAETIPSSSSQILLALVDPPPDFAGQLGFFGQVVEGIELLSELTTEDVIESITIVES